MLGKAKMDGLSLIDNDLQPSMPIIDFDVNGWVRKN
jgi:hypothetical protein